MYNTSYGKDNINTQIYMYYFNKSFLSLKSAMTDVIKEQENIVHQGERKNYLTVATIYSFLLKTEVERCIDCVIYFQALLETIFNDYLDIKRLEKNGSFKTKGDRILSHIDNGSEVSSDFSNYLSGYRKLRNDVVHPSSSRFDYKVYNIYDVYFHLQRGYEVYRFIITTLTGGYCTTWEENISVLEFPNIDNPVNFKSYNAAALQAEAHRKELQRLGRTDI